MFQDSSKKGKEKVYVSRSKAVMISRGATVAHVPLNVTKIESNAMLVLLNVTMKPSNVRKK